MKKQTNMDTVLARVKGNRRAQRVASALACLVVFVTLWRLILPAITLEWGKPQAEGISEPETLPEEELLPEENLSDEAAEEEEPLLRWATLKEAEEAGYPDAVRVDRLSCGQEESETHRHSASCFESYYTAQTASFAEEAFLAMPAQRFEGEAGSLSVRVDAEEGTFPEATEMALAEADTAEVRRAAAGLVNGRISQVLAVDIGFLYEGEKIEPEQPVQVVLSGSALEGLENPVVLHIDGEGNAEIVSHRTAEEPAPAPRLRMAARSAQPEETLAADIAEENSEGAEAADEAAVEAEDGIPYGALVFEAKEFSVYAVVSYTVDFTYESRTWSFPGQGSYHLTDVLAALGIEGSIDDAALTLIMEEDHAGALYLTQVDGEYYINSDIPFKDTYELRVRVGEKIYIITVADNQESANLSDFLKNAVITGATQDPDGSYHVESGEEYSIILTIAESSNYQFKNTETLTYQMPEGITILTKQESDGNINIVYKGRTYQIGFHYVLDTDGSLEIKFDQSDPDFPRLEESTNVSFRFTYTGAFDGSKTTIKFNDVVEKDITFDEPEPGQAYVEKKGVFDETTGKIKYTITVTADGDVTDVNVKDVLTGDALIFNNDVQVSGNSGSYTDNGASNGFDYTFDSMSDGETITIEYTASVNFGKDTDNDGKITVDQTKNTVTVKPDDGDPHNSEFSREINYKTTSKSDGTDGGTTTEGNKILNWTIDYNPLALASAAGDTIKDTIGASSREYMKYYGSGITVQVYDHAGNPVETRTIPYTDLTAHSDSTWTYTIPETDTEPYHYTITYQTIVDMEKVEAGGVTISLDNDGNGDHGGVSVTPKNLVDIKKDVESFNTQEVTWISTISVPEGGLAQAVVTDTLPRIWLNESNHYDVYKDGSLEITGLLGGETYTVEYGQGSVKITFSKDGESGLKGTPGGHNITIKLTTKVDQEWLQKGYDTGSWEQNHTNTIALGSKTDTATVTFGKPGIEKKGVRTGDSSFKYTVVLSGVSEVPISLEDTFDTSLLEVDTSKANEWDHMRIWGGNQYSQDAGRYPISYTDTSGGVLLTANSVPMMDNGQYYPYYKIIYYLKLKDGVDLQQLAIANGGEHHLVNTAKWGDHEDEFDYTTKYDFLNKELLNEGQLGDASRKAQYRITFNPAGATLNNGEPMVMTDVMSANLSVDYSSIRIVTDPAGQEVPYSLSGGKDEHGVPNGTTVATYTVPDSTKVVITYDADVRGNGSQTIVNTVSVNDEDETITTTKSYGTVSEGEGAVASFKIVKVDGYDANKKLKGVKFRIFAENPDIDFGGGVKELVLETDENGEINLDGEKYHIYFDECYHVQEVEPLDDYGTIGFDYLVTLTNNMEQVDYGDYVYYYSDSMQIKNWPLEGLVVEKQVESPDNSDKERYYEFRISILKDDGTVDTSYNEKNGDDQFVKGVVTFKLKDKEQKMFWGFKKGTKYKVEEIDNNGMITSVTYKVFDEDGNVTETKTESGLSHSGILTQENEIITFKNSKTEQKGALKFTKAVKVNGEDTTTTAANGEYTFTVKGPGTTETVRKTVVIKVENGVATKYKIDDATTFTDLPADKFVVISDLTPGEYTITETNSTNTNMTLASITGGKDGTANVQNKQVTVTVTAGETIEAAATATFTNNLPTTEVEVNKTWLVGTEEIKATDYSGMLDEMFGSVTVELGVVKVSENATVEQIEAADIVKDVFGNDAKATMSAPTWSATVSNLPVLETGYKYAVKELSVKSGTTDISSYFTTGLNETTVNNTPELTEVIVTKQWKPTIPENTTITLGLYSGKAAATANTQITEIVLDGTADDVAENISSTDTKAGTMQETAGWTAEFKNLPKYAYDTTDGIYEIKYVVKESVVPDGYTVNYGGEGAGSDYVITGGTITNTKKPGDLELTKKVAGGGDTSKEFEFTIELTAPAGETLAESYTFKKGDAEATGITYTRNGTATETESANSTATVTGIKLKADQTFTIIGLPAGTTYKITETDYSAAGYSSDIPAEGKTGTITGGTTEKETVEVTNTLSAAGLTVEKTLEGNATNNATNADKEFDFKVTFEKSGLNENIGTYKIGTSETIESAVATNITFTAGKAEITFELIGGQKAVFTALPTGTTFTVEETSKDADGYETTVSSTGATVNADKTVTGTISSTAAVTASYINKKNTTTAEATKAWKNGDTTIAWPVDVDSVEFTLYKTVNNQTTQPTDVVASDLTNYWTDINTFTNPIAVSSSTEGQKASWADLPTRMLVTTTETVDQHEVTTSAWYDVSYSVKETKINYTAASGKTAETVDVSADENKIITNSPKTSIHVSKEWQQKDGNSLTGNQIPENAKVTFTLLANGTAVKKTVGGEAVDRTVTLNGTDATERGTITPASEDYEGAGWTAYFTNLPVYDADGKVIKYTVKETVTWPGYVLVTTGEGVTYPAVNDGKIINKESSLALDILKVDKAGTPITTGASFRIVQINDTDQADEKTGTEKTGTTNNGGKLTFDGLTVGYYKITEQTPPPGYVLPIDANFYVEVTETDIKLLTKGTGKPSTWDKTQTSGGVVKTFTMKTENANAQATVENTPGTSLPSTGGPGTRAFTLAGLALTLLALAGITGKRKRR